VEKGTGFGQKKSRKNYWFEVHAGFQTKAEEPFGGGKEKKFTGKAGRKRKTERSSKAQGGVLDQILWLLQKKRSSQKGGTKKIQPNGPRAFHLIPRAKGNEKKFNESRYKN